MSLAWKSRRCPSRRHLSVLATFLHRFVKGISSNSLSFLKPFHLIKAGPRPYRTYKNDSGGPSWENTYPQAPPLRFLASTNTVGGQKIAFGLKFPGDLRAYVAEHPTAVFFPSCFKARSTGKGAKPCISHPSWLCVLTHLTPPSNQWNHDFPLFSNKTCRWKRSNDDKRCHERG